MYELQIAGERVQLSPHRAMYLPEHSTIAVADLHWGKAATFRATGIPLPAGTTADDLARLSLALHETDAQRLVIVGDLIHARQGRAERTFAAIEQWRAAHAQLEIILVRGNHDERAGDPPVSLNIRCVDAPLVIGAIAFQHHPGTSEDHYVVAGHLHPHVHLRGRGRQGVRLPCFAFGEHMGILPAFTTFTGVGAFTPSRDDRIYVIAGHDVIPAQ